MQKKIAWERRHPDRKHAHVTLWNAVYAGKLVRPSSCQTCGRELPVQGHHEDYTKPLEVQWLCKECHSAADIARRVRESLPPRTP